MSGSGAPALDIAGVAGLRVAVVASSWHQVVMDGLVDGAVRTLDGLDVRYELIRVPGAFELPIVARAAAVAGFDAVVALGVVVRGGTPHFDYVCQAATVGLTEVSVKTGVPVGFGVLTCDTVEQAFERSGLPGSKEDKGYEAATAAVTTAVTLYRLTGRP